MAVPDGILFEPLIKMRELIANSASFQAWVGVANDVDALPFIFLFEDEPGIKQKYATIESINALRMERDAVGSGFAAFNTTDGSQFGFIETIDDDYTEDTSIEFLNNAGAILRDIFNNQSQDPFKEIDVIEAINVGMRWKDDTKLGYQIFFREQKDI